MKGKMHNHLFLNNLSSKDAYQPSKRQNMFLFFLKEKMAKKLFRWLIKQARIYVMYFPLLLIYIRIAVSWWHQRELSNVWEIAENCAAVQHFSLILIKFLLWLLWLSLS